MIVLDTHIWFWWINGDLSRLSVTPVASADGQFRAYPELAGRLLA